MPKVIATEEQWILVGMERFARGGAEAMVIERMAAELNCSKSSFYWYFKDRGEFLKRVVDRWMEATTEEVKRIASAKETALRQIESVLLQMFSATGKGDFLYYLRKLSEEAPAYRDAIDRMERDRMGFMEGLLLEAGTAPDKARAKSEILYHYYLGWYERNKQTRLEAQDVRRHVEKVRANLLEL